MSTRVPQPAENFDSTAKLMLEALAKASAELEKSVTAFNEQLISFNDELQKSLEGELRSINDRLAARIRANLDELGHNKHLLMKRLHETECNEINALSAAGKEVRTMLAAYALQTQEKIETFMQERIAELQEFLQQPDSQINACAEAASSAIAEKQSNISFQLKHNEQSLRRRLADKIAEIEVLIQEECQKVKNLIVDAVTSNQRSLNLQGEEIRADMENFAGEALKELDVCADEGISALQACELQHKETLDEVNLQWTEKVSTHCQNFDKTISDLSSVLKENYETKLSDISEQAKHEITHLAGAAQEKIATTRTELNTELHELEREYVHHFEETIYKLEMIVAEHANDKRNSLVARQHKAQKLQDQMHNHLQYWGEELVESVRDSAEQLENEYSRATDGFHTRIETARVAAVEILERESHLMEKDIERTFKDFQQELSDLQDEIDRIRKAGQDAALTVIACRKAVLSFRGE